MSWRHRAAALAVLALAAPLVAAAAPSRPPTPAPTPPAAPPRSGAGSITRVSLGTPGSVTTAPCIGGAPDGTVWLITVDRRNLLHLVHLGDGGVLSSAPFPGTAPGLPLGECLAVTRDGTVWVTGAEPTVDAFDPASGMVTRYPAVARASRASDIVAAPDGGVWLDDHGSANQLRHILGGAVTTIPLPAGVTGGGSLTVTPDGNVWLVANGPSVSAFGTSVHLTLFELSPQGTLLQQLSVAHSIIGALSLGFTAYVVATGPDGRPWVGWGPYPVGVEEVATAGRMRPTAWPSLDWPAAMQAGPDGRLWYVIASGVEPNYGVINPTTLAVTPYRLPRIQPRALAAGPGVAMTFVSGDSFAYLVSTGLPQPSTLTPSTIASALPTPLQAFGNAAVVLTSAAIAAGSVMFITFPAQLFNLTFQENYGEITGWWRRRRGILAALLRRRRAPSSTVAADANVVMVHDRPTSRVRENVAFGFVVLAGALLGALLDPRFGRSWTTALSFIATCLAIVSGVSVTAAVTGAFHRHVHGRADRHLRALPLGIAVAAVCVLVSRLVDFEPGYLYGVVCGVAFAAPLTARQEGQVAALGTLSTLAVSTVSWLLWVPVEHLATMPGASPLAVLAADLLAAIFVAGIVGSAIGLLPLRFLPGGTISAWRRTVWVPLYLVSMFTLIDVVVRSPASPGAHVSPLLTTVVLFVLFGGAAIGFREYFARRWRMRHGVTLAGPREWVRDLFRAHPA